LEKRVDGYFVSNDEVNKGKKILTYVGIGTIAWKVLRFIIASPVR
jgi:hypothetical protein